MSKIPDFEGKTPWFLPPRVGRSGEGKNRSNNGLKNVEIKIILDLKSTGFFIKLFNYKICEVLSNFNIIKFSFYCYLVNNAK